MELDLTVLLNLKCEEIYEIGTPIVEQTEVIFKFRELSKGVELNSLSKHVNLIYLTLYYFIVQAIIWLNRR